MSAFIPPEILSQIFIHAVSTSYADRVLGPDSCPILLTLVNRYWRAVAQSTPQIWTDLCLPDIPRSVANVDSFFEAVEGWLSYSGHRPVSLSLYSEQTDKALLSRYVSILCAHAERWRSISFDFRIPDPDIFPPLNRIVMPLLESFSYQTHNLDTPYGYTDMIPFAWPLRDGLICASRLHTVQLVHPLSTLLLTPSCSITNLDIKFVSSRGPITVHLARFLFCIASCPNLEVLRVSYEEEEENIILFTAGVTRIRLPRLTTLNFTFDQSFFFFKILLDNLEVPKLKHLEISANESNRDLYDSLGDFIMRVSPTLQAFESSGKLLNDADLAEACQRLPHLTYLFAWDYMVAGNAFINSLRLRFFPNGQLRFGQNTSLQSLHIHVNGSWNAGFGCTFEEYYLNILEVVKSRWRLPDCAKDFAGKEVQRLREISFAGWSEDRIRNEAPRAYDMLMKFREEGLVVRFVNSDWTEEVSNDGDW